jgi:hypothetical protein
MKILAGDMKWLGSSRLKGLFGNCEDEYVLLV